MSDLFIFSVLILSTITAFGAGYFCGLFRGSQKKKYITSDNISLQNNPLIGSTLAPISIKEKPTHSAVLKMPTPEEIRKKKEKDSTQDYWNHLEGKKRDKGTFRLETNDL